MKEVRSHSFMQLYFQLPIFIKKPNKLILLTLFYVQLKLRMKHCSTSERI